MNSIYRIVALPLLFVTLMMSARVTDTIASDLNRFAPLKRPFVMSLSVGKLMNLGGNPDEAYFGRRASVNTEIDMLFSGFFNRHLGAYGMLSICGNPWKYERMPVLGFEHYIPIEDSGLPFVCTCAIQFGGVYRYEIRRWQFSARAGIGVRGMGVDEWHFYKSDAEGQPDIEAEFIQVSSSVAPFIVTGCITAGYRTSSIVSLTLEVECRHRIGSPDKVTYKRILPAKDNAGTVLEQSVHKSYSFGKELVIRIGLQLQCELSRPGKKNKKKK